MQPLSEEQALRITTDLSARLDDVEDASLRLLPFLTENKEVVGDLATNARLIASVSFALNGELVARHYRRFHQIVKKSRSESDVPVLPSENFITALDHATSVVDNLLAVSDALDAVFEDGEDVYGGEVAIKLASLYKDNVDGQARGMLQLGMGMQHGLLLANAGFDFDGITAAVKAAPEAPEDNRRYL